jgi:hypothetical protein
VSPVGGFAATTTTPKEQVMFSHPDLLQKLVSDRHREAAKRAEAGRWQHERRQVRQGVRRRGR